MLQATIVRLEAKINEFEKTISILRTQSQGPPTVQPQPQAFCNQENSDINFRFVHIENKLQHNYGN